MEKETAPESQSSLFYIIGGLLIVAVVAGGWFLRSKTTTTPPGAPVVTAPTPTPGPITGLGCDNQYYNSKIGFAEYYLSVEGGDLSPAKEVDCIFTATSSGRIVAKVTVTSPLTDAPQRGGKTFRCTTRAIELEPDVPTVVDVALKDDLKKTSSCSATFLLPAP